MSPRVVFSFDDVLDVVSAKLADACVVRARPVATDAHMVLKLDASGRVVGLELLGPTGLRPTFWRAHPARNELPVDLLVELDKWLEALWSTRR